MEGEFLRVGRTFIMSVLALIASVLLIVLGKIPDPISMTSWVALLAVTNGMYTAKSVADKIAGAKKGS